SGSLCASISTSRSSWMCPARCSPSVSLRVGRDMGWTRPPCARRSKATTCRTPNWCSRGALPPTSSSRTRTQADDKLVQLLERLFHRTFHPFERVERFLRGIEIVHDHERLATLLLEGPRGHGPAVIAFLIGPDEARMRCHFDISTVERHGR